MFKLNQVFHQHDTLKPLLQQADQRQQWQRLWAQIAPEFGAYSQALALNDNILTVSASSGMVANRIRLLESELLRRFQEIRQKSKQIKGLNLNAIKVKVQVKNSPPARQKRIQPLSSQALQSLQRCADHTSNTALQQALNSLVKHQRQR